MFYSIKGVVNFIVPPNRLILQIHNNFSFEVFIPLNMVELIKKNFLKKEIMLYVVCLIKKSEYPEIYGFLEREERELFIKLNTLSKIGPKLALNILSVLSPQELRRIILQKDIGELSKVPGIGPKRAEKLFLELKALFVKPSFKGLTIPVEKETLLEEAKDCLISLGFRGKEIEKVLYKVFTQEDTLDTLIKKALKELAPKLKEETF